MMHTEEEVKEMVGKVFWLGFATGWASMLLLVVFMAATR